MKGAVLSKHIGDCYEVGFVNPKCHLIEVVTFLPIQPWNTTARAAFEVNEIRRNAVLKLHGCTRFGCPDGT